MKPLLVRPWVWVDPSLSPSLPSGHVTMPPTTGRLPASLWPARRPSGRYRARPASRPTSTHPHSFSTKKGTRPVAQSTQRRPRTEDCQLSVGLRMAHHQHRPWIDSCPPKLVENCTYLHLCSYASHNRGNTPCPLCLIA